MAENATFGTPSTAPAEALFQAEAHPKVHALVASCLHALIGADELIRFEIRPPGGGTRAFAGGDLHYDPQLSAAFTRYRLEHPAVQSYLRPKDDCRPRRVSDVASQATWLSSATYVNVFRARGGRHQLSIVTHLDGRAGCGWLLTRTLHDFTDRDVDMARDLRPLLALFGAAHLYAPICADDIRLTRRETQVVALLGGGLTANAIAHRCGMSPRTAQKHLENIYRKLGTNDRVTTLHRLHVLNLFE
jgi:DNA-binding CsgD family transcriptional regulator